MSWHETDAFWAAVEPALFAPERLAKAAEEIGAIERLAKIPPGSRVLDLGTGPGRHAIELARRGHRVTGVDRTRRYLERARASASEAGVAIELVEEDMRRFVRPGAFDAAVNLFTSFGYFEDPADERRVAENLRASLRPGGIAVLEMSGREVVARTFSARGWMDAPGCLVAEERRVRPGWEWIDSRWIVCRDGERQEFAVSVRTYSGSELKALLLAAGFKAVELYGTLEGSPYDQTALRLVAVARA